MTILVMIQAEELLDQHFENQNNLYHADMNKG